MGSTRLYEVAVAVAPAAAAAYAARGLPLLAAAALVAAALPLAGLYWLSILVSAAVSAVALHATHSIEALASLVAAAAAAAAAPRPLPRPPTRPPRSLLLALALAAAAPLQAYFAVRSLETVEPYSYLARGAPGLPGVFYAASAAVVASAAYLAASPPRTARPARRPSTWPLELLVYSLTIAPASKAKAVVLAVIAGVAAGGLASVTGRTRLRLPAYMAAYTAALLLLGAAVEVDEFYRGLGG